MERQRQYRELVKNAAEGVIAAADELKAAIKEDNVPRISASTDRLRNRTDALKTELIVLHRLAPDQEV
jgi:ubiquinone biosynthesis protein UbiJ